MKRVDRCWRRIATVLVLLLAYHAPLILDAVRASTISVYQNKLVQKRVEFGSDYYIDWHPYSHWGRQHALWLVARETLLVGQPASAIPLLREVLEEHPRYHFGWALLGESYEATGNVSEAIAAYANVRWSSRLYELGDRMSQAGRFRESLAAYRAILDYNPNDGLANLYAGHVLNANLDEAQESLQYLLAATRLLQGNVWSSLELGLAYQKLENADAARFWFETAKNQDEVLGMRYLAEHWAWQGDRFTHSGDWEQARTAYQRALLLNPDSYAGNLGMGSSFWLSEGDASLAVVYLKKAVSSTSQETRARLVLSDIYAALGDFNTALGWARAANMANDGQSVAIHLRLAELHARLGNCNSAQLEIVLASDLSPTNSRIAETAVQVSQQCHH